MHDGGQNTHPDHWGAGLAFRGKALNANRVTRAAGPSDVLRVCLSHNLRSGNEEHRHRSRIDSAKTGLNEVLRGPICLDVAAGLASGILDSLGIRPARRDTIMGIELVFQPPAGADTPVFWSSCLAWAEERYAHIVSAVIHRDQVRPHMHLLALAVAGGRLDGTYLTAGANRFMLQRRDFMAHMRDVLGLRPDRKVKTLADLAVSAGKGAKTRIEAARRDAELACATGTHWKRTDLGMVVDGHGGVSPERGKHHAQGKTPTTTVARLSRFDALSAQWATVAEFRRRPGAPMPPCPKPSAGYVTPSQAPAVAAGGGRMTFHAEVTAAPALRAEPDNNNRIRREREMDRSANQWCEELGEFIEAPATPSRTARTDAAGWVAAELVRIGKRGVQGQ